jgi:putative ABC transport system permease protein
MNVIESVRIALRGLASNKMRAILTMLGIIIGVAAVIALMAIGQGVQNSVTQQIQGIGSNLVIITPGATQQGAVRTAQGSAATLTYEDAQALMDFNVAPDIAGVSPEFGSAGQVVYGGQNFNVRITGVTPDYETVRNVVLDSGAFVDKSELDSLSRVAVLGATTAKNLFLGDDPIGKEIKINRSIFKVIGVLQAKGGSPMLGGDDIILVPITTAQKRLFGGQLGFGAGSRVSTIYISAASEGQVDAAIQEITEVLRERHKTTLANDDFTVTSQKDILGVLDQITGLMTAFLGAIAGISLVVGGIGIMNIMLVSVTERTREIGIRKAVGAKRRDILVQFLVEAVVLSVVGGLGGIALGWGFSQLVNVLKIGTPSPLVTAVTPDAVILAVSFSVAIGLFFGIYPANRASSLNPIDALRYE